MSVMKESIKQLLNTVDELRKEYPHKRFTLDGRLVGDIGEVLCSEIYDIELLPGLAAHYDGQTSDGWNVQIKTTMQENLTFPADHIPDYFLGVKVQQDGTVEEVFNGPGKIIKDDALKNRTAIPKNHLHSISIKKLQELNKSIPDAERIKKRKLL